MTKVKLSEEEKNALNITIKMLYDLLHKADEAKGGELWGDKVCLLDEDIEETAIYLSTIAKVDEWEYEEIDQTVDATQLLKDALIKAYKNPKGK